MKFDEFKKPLKEANAPFGTMGGGIRPPSGGAAIQSAGIKPPSSGATVQGYGIRPPSAATASTAQTSAAPAAAATPSEDWRAPHGDESQEFAMFKAGTKPAVIVRGNAINWYKDLLNTGNYPFKKMTSQGVTSYVIGQPTEQDRVSKIHQLVSTAAQRGEQGDFSAYNNSNYHRLLGKLLGYPKDKIDQFVAHLFRNKQDLAQQHFAMENKNVAEEKVRLDPKCWTGKKIGNPKTKMKGGVRVNNCVPAESVAEGLPQTLRKVVPGHAKREIDRKMDAGKFGKTDADKDANFQRYKKIQDKIKEQGVAEDYNPEYDDEAGMAQGSLHTLQNAVAGLQDVIDSGDNLPEWCQEKISLAEDYLVTVWDYIQSEKAQGIDPEISEEFDMIERIIESIAAHNGVDADAVWTDLESLTEDELYAFAVTSQLNEDWQKANKRDRTAGMSQKAVNAYRRENPGSKLQTAVTTKPSKLKKGSKASKRRKSYCSRSRGQMKMHNISCAKTPDKAICKARRRWNC